VQIRWFEVDPGSTSNRTQVEPTQGSPEVQVQVQRFCCQPEPVQVRVQQSLADPTLTRPSATLVGARALVDCLADVVEGVSHEARTMQRCLVASY